MAARARVPHEPARRTARLGRVGRARVPRVGAEADRARLRDRRARRQGRLVRAAGAARRAARPAAMGARVQVGADDRHDEAEQDPDPRRSHRGPEPVGDARAGRGRRRDGLSGDAPQRGGHQPQGHPRGRHGDRPAGGRRDPAGRRPGPAARERDEAVPDAEEVPALRGRDRQAGGRGDASLPESRLPVTWARVADQLGAGGRRHRGRRRAVGAPALGPGAGALAPRAVPADEGAADGARRLRRDLRVQVDRVDRGLEADARSAACSSGSTSPTSAG